MIGGWDPTAWVIGGLTGIGLATADELTLRGYKVETTGENVDVRNESALSEFWHEHDGFEKVVYSAGVNVLQWNVEQDMAISKDLFDVNVFGFMRLIKVMSSWFLENEDKFLSGTQLSVVAVSSDAATRPMRTSQAYCASKAALNAVVKQSAREHANLIRVNAVSPGMIDGTDMTKYIDKTVPEIRGWSPEISLRYEQSQIPVSRRGRPGEVARLISDVLAGPDYLTGSIIEINGGR